jgi:cation diffusion facilitator CzcD-associated flavoprotein CzcO
VYQRSASWVMPKLDLALPGPLRALFRAVPLVQKALRAGVFGGHELLHLAQFHPSLLGAFEQLCLRQLRRQVPDPDIRAKLTPGYRFSCKRPLISNDYYRAFMRDNVELITDAVAGIDQEGVVDATGKRADVDAIIWGTGFHVQDMYRFFPDIVSRGNSIRKKIERDGLQSYRGIALHGFPNVFTVTGPNAVLAHTSFILAIETNVAHIVGIIAQMRSKGIASAEVSESAERAFTEKAHRTLGEAVWSVGGCNSYFIDENRVNRIAWPGSAVHQRITMRKPELTAFRTTNA